MAQFNYNLLELNIDKLFEDHKIEEIVEIEKLLDAEIERKRNELRSMVGDRYKDVLAASDAIKNMKDISENIVNNIEKCQKLITSEIPTEVDKTINIEEKVNTEEVVFIIQVRLAMIMNEEIWVALDNSDNLRAAEFYLLAQHVHLGLNLSRPEYLEKVPMLQQIYSSLVTIRRQILKRIRQKLESVEINSEETSSNLNALFLLENQNVQQLLNTFIEHRKIALNTVINNTYSSVRVQISAMVKCLITTVHLLHDCFLYWKNEKKGLIWQQLEDLISDKTEGTLSKVELPKTPLIAYIPDIIKKFKPKCNIILDEEFHKNLKLDEWLTTTKLLVEKGLESSLKLITNLKGLHLIREESLKIDLPADWEKICAEASLPDAFNVWYYFFQYLITNRAKELIIKKVSTIIQELKGDIKKILDSKLDQSEINLRRITWIEDLDDVSRIENKHHGLAMKTRGYSKKIMELCEKLNSKYLDFLTDISHYLYGKEYDSDSKQFSKISLDTKTKMKFLDRDDLENHLKTECITISTQLTVFLQELIKVETNPDLLVLKSLTCARFLQAITNLCPHLNKCCTLSGNSDDWNKSCDYFSKSCIEFWKYWVERCVMKTEEMIEQEISSIDTCAMLTIFTRWSAVEIQEHTDDQQMILSKLKVPLKPSLLLYKILEKLNDDISKILPHTLPKQIHSEYLEGNLNKILLGYQKLNNQQLNQNQALQFLFDVRFLTLFCIQRENTDLIKLSQDICDKYRTKIDPFDLDVCYSYVQNNVKRAVLQSQTIFGCLLPSSTQLINIGLSDKSKEQEKEPSILALSTPSITSWFPLLPISVPTQKPVTSLPVDPKNTADKPVKTTPKKSQDPAALMRSSAAAIFGGFTSDWFS